MKASIHLSIYLLKLAPMQFRASSSTSNQKSGTPSATSLYIAATRKTKPTKTTRSEKKSRKTSPEKITKMRRQSRLIMRPQLSLGFESEPGRQPEGSLGSNLGSVSRQVNVLNGRRQRLFSLSVWHMIFAKWKIFRVSTVRLAVGRIFVMISGLLRKIFYFVWFVGSFTTHWSLGLAWLGSALHRQRHRHLHLPFGKSFWSGNKRLTRNQWA